LRYKDGEKLFPVIVGSQNFDDFLEEGSLWFVTLAPLHPKSGKI